MLLTKLYILNNPHNDCELNQSRAALAAIVIVIPLAMLATLYTGGRPAQQQTSEGQGKIAVVASFYPLYEFASRVGGDRAEVSSLVPAGIEPHDWEPTPRDVSRARSADMMVINGAGFESWAGGMEAKVVVNTSEGTGLEHEGGQHDLRERDPLGFAEVRDQAPIENRQTAVAGVEQVAGVRVAVKHRPVGRREQALG